jgi:cytochrome P450
MRYTVDVTTNLAFGHDMNTLENEGDVIQRHLERIFPTMHRRINAPFPYWRFLRLPADRAFDSSMKAVHEIVSGFVEETRTKLKREPQLAEQPTNFLEAMLAARDEDGSAFTDSEIFANVITMLLAGEDTTANTMAWMIDFLTDFPEVQTRLQTESEARVDASGLTGSSAQGLDGLGFIEAVAHESMRLKPVAPLLFLEPNEDVELRGVRIPRGTAMMLSTMHSCLQDEHFENAAEFRPERWLAGNDRPGCPHNSRAFVPFGAGPRFCPGRSLAMLEIKMVAAMMGRCFSLTKALGRGPVREQFAFTLMPENLFLKFERRR